MLNLLIAATLASSQPLPPRTMEVTTSRSGEVLQFRGSEFLELQCPGGICPQPPSRVSPFEGRGGRSGLENGGKVGSDAGNSKTIDKTVALIHSPTVGAGGSGVCVYAQDGVGVLLTARHIYVHSTKTWVDMATYRADTILKFPGGKQYRAAQATVHPQVSGPPPQTDLAFVLFNYTGEPPLSTVIADRSPTVGSDVWQVGFPAQEQGRIDIRSGKVLRGEQGMVRASVLIRSGNSGGGLFDSSGRLVGITVTSYTQDPNQYCNAVATETCKRFYETHCLPILRRRPPAQPRPPAAPNYPGTVPEAPSTPPAMPPATPPVSQPVVPSGPDSTALLQQILSRLERLEQQRAVQGPKGEPGKDGVNGKDADMTRLKNLEEEIARLKTKPLVVELVGPDGRILKTQEFGPDKPLKLQLIPVK